VDDELRATRVFVVPDVGSLFSPGWRVHSVRIEDAYVSVVRQRDGRLVVLPALLRRASSDPAPTDSADPPMAVDISTLELSNASVDFFDASVRRIPHRMQLTQLQVRLEALALPQLDRAVQLDLQGVFDGRQRDGRIEIRGEVTPATRDAQLQARFSGVDLTSLQPYLLRVNEGGVRSGTLDLSLQARVVKNQLEAPGKLVLTDLALAPGGGPMATFAGVPRQAVLAAMSRDGRIELNFVLKGRLDDPAFSINDNLALRVAVGLAETLGVSLGGVVQGLGDVVKGLFGR
jgi:uncharacterized protein involved in outer membrane biogenesis